MFEGVFLHSVAKALLVVHAACAVVTIGATTHHGWLAVRELRDGIRRTAQQRLHVAVLATAYIVTFALGVLIYPAFRVYVRAAYFDASVPLATGFFEVKEHWLALGLALLFVQVPLSRSRDEESGALERRVFVANALILTAIVWLAMFTGFGLSVVRPV